MGVLEGVRVIDLTRIVAGPYCGRLLADFGAEVIRVENPGGGEDRFLGLRWRSGDGFIFLNQALNKKAITLNFTHSEVGMRILRELVTKSDIVMHAFPLDVAQAIGITYSELKEMNPRLILLEISGFGSTGPYAHRLAIDPVAQAMSGTMATTGFPGGPPVRASTTFVDYGTGTMAALGVMLALYHRQQTGKGQRVEVSLLQTAVSWNAVAASEYGATGAVRQQLGNRAYYMGPDDCYKAKDGWLVIAIVTNALFERWAKAVGKQELLSRPEFATDVDRFEHREELDKIVRDWIAGLTVAKAEEELSKMRLPYGRIQSIPEVFSNPQVQECQMLVEIDCGELGKLKLGGVPIRLSETAHEIRRSPPKAGEHNDEIYSEILGYSADYISWLREKGII